MGNCLTDSDWNAYFGGPASQGQRAAWRDHLEDCDACAEYLANRLAAIEGITESLRGPRAFGADPAPQSPSPAADGTAAVTDGESAGAIGVVPGYKILGELHRGGQGIVYRAMQLAGKRTVALKVLRGGSAAGERARRRFEREVELVAGLRHPNIVTFHDSGVTRGDYYFVMDYIRGTPLDAYVHTNKLSIRDRLLVFRKVCDAISYAHQRGIIHRDLKPSNILVDDTGEPHVIDFGLAKTASAQALNAAGSILGSMTGQVMGTLAYMAPEQAAGRPDAVDVRTDVYALGVILYQILTGTFPYEVDGDTFAVLNHIRHTEPRRPTTLIRRLPVDVETIMLKAMAKEPQRRYQSVTELGGDLDAWLDGRAISARSDSSIYVIRKLIARHRYTSAVAGLLLLILLAAAGVSLEFYRREQQAIHERDTRSRDAGRLLRERDEFSGLVRSAERTLRFQRFLLAQNQGRREEARALAAEFPTDSREGLGAALLLERAPDERKNEALHSRLGPENASFVYLVLGERYLHDGDRTMALQAFERSAEEAAGMQAPHPLDADAWMRMWVTARRDHLRESQRLTGTSETPHARGAMR